VCRRNGVTRLRVFGSYARGEATKESDVDLIVDFSTPKSLIGLVRIEREMSAALGVRVDLLTEGAISPYIRERIGDDLRVVYEAG
jgi:predicted nucleotidyltransferase